MVGVLSLFCFFMAYDKQGSKSPHSSPSSSLPACRSGWESARSQKAGGSPGPSPGYQKRP